MTVPTSVKALTMTRNMFLGRAPASVAPEGSEAIFPIRARSTHRGLGDE